MPSTSISTPAVTRATTGCMCTGMPGVVCSAIAVQTRSMSRRRDVVGLQEVARGVGAVDLEALGPAAVPGCQAHVVEHRAGIEQLAVERQAAPQAGQRAEVVDPTRMVEEQVRLGIADKLGDLLAQLAVGDADPFDRVMGLFLPSALKAVIVLM